MSEEMLDLEFAEPPEDVTATAEERVARALLMRVAEPGQAAVGAAVARLGAAEVIERVRTRRIKLLGGEAMRIRMTNVDPFADLEVAEVIGARLICPADPDWPTQLDDLGDCRPFGLWCRGGSDLRPALLNSVSIVGARAASPYGVHVATDLAAELGEEGWTVVSGGAFGIDVAAHRGALAAGGVTVAVLAGGVDIPYPRAHATLFDRIADDGAVLSEAAFGAAPASRRFLSRNRVIAALTRGTVVVEAASRSGAATTARWAEELNRVLMAVPGPVTSAVSVGSNDLLRTRAAVAVTRATEIVEALGRLGLDLAPEIDRPSRPRDDLPPEVRGVLEAFPARAATDLAAIAAECGQPDRSIHAALGELAVLGLVERTEDGWQLTRAARQR